MQTLRLGVMRKRRTVCLCGSEERFRRGRLEQGEPEREPTGKGLGGLRMSDDDGERVGTRTRPAKADRVGMNSGRETILKL